MSVDNTHTKYLHGNDKKVWENYKKALESQKQLDNFMKNLEAKIPKLKAGESYDIPVHKGKKKKE